MWSSLYLAGHNPRASYTNTFLRHLSSSGETEHWHPAPWPQNKYLEVHILPFRQRLCPFRHPLRFGFRIYHHIIGQKPVKFGVAKADLLLHPDQHFLYLLVQKLFGTADADHGVIIVRQVLNGFSKWQKVRKSWTFGIWSAKSRGKQQS